MIPFTETPDLALYAVRVLMALGILITTGELLANWRDHADGGFSGWPLLRQLLEQFKGGPVLRFAVSLVSHARFLGWLGLRALCAAALLVPALPAPLVLAALALLFVTDLLVSMRLQFGKDGSDRMVRLLNVALLLVALAPGNPRVRDAGLAFIALQGCLAYFTTGVWKALGPQWRDGQAVFLVFNTRAHGTRPVAAMLARQPWLTRLLSWSVVGVEALFPLALVGGPTVALVFLAWGVVFHATNSLVMGLNPFFFAFVATYPAILFCAAHGVLLP
ncbi:hypothetical protein D7X55_25110 [Corallococcus sp. AB049A]|uniref:HTTM-like domain-containing protein n=1 Tax=Corallococcus interemptor TaxID=2316720 RepID=A0A3A8QRM9_9BACT|nr:MULTISPECIES: hypothetical protein [Corallococcus]RKH45852.1 hypothetical protein D7Y23_24915 [Corallococcus sp. AB050B]RKH70461.1 hypothetical protein D7X96_11420 [Corallococcus interemptor]RKI59910.1 hypothetical protein D7X55_25110 [Corallococcus sp. AB049A]